MEFHIFLYLLFPLVFTFRDQIVGVRGKLTCNNRLLQGATIRLIEKNYIGPDVILAENKTNFQGSYEVVGKGRGMLEMNVFLRMFHDCDDKVIKFYF
ncbi:hypothetical protein B9Z55_022576 [Caenorhabditis nigoni]|uniref:Transthyretin-like family protein n=1 Tax=Caenorhabditis nigoni TaxID=1611254 RepID=A0A2G5SL12_9PELO|nr:hypothetical protein B9Z55_022576 [Caenorhabditis nigoni]